MQSQSSPLRRLAVAACVTLGCSTPSSTRVSPRPDASASDAPSSTDATTSAGGATGAGTGGAAGVAGAGGTAGSGGARAAGGATGTGGSPATDAGADRPPSPPGTTPPITPRWAFEPWAWEDNTNTRQSTEALIAGYVSRQIPVGAVIIDSPWETTYNTLAWDTTRYPSPQAMIAGFHAQGVKVVMWLVAFVDTDAPSYAMVKQQGYGVNGGANATWWKGTGIHVDVTNPAAATWWNGLLGGVLADGIDGWKLDRGADYIGDPIQTMAGSISATDFKKRLSADFYDYYDRQKSERHCDGPSLRGGAGADRLRYLEVLGGLGRRPRRRVRRHRDAAE